MGASALAKALEPSKVDEMRGFPHSLGSIASVPTPLTKEDVWLQGNTWTLTSRAMHKYNLSSYVTGLLSPRQQIRCVGAGQRLAKVPHEARTMMWSYPVEGWQDLSMKAAVPPEVAAFLQVGGFVYMDAHGEITSIHGIMATTQASRGSCVNFKQPIKFDHPDWMSTLVAQGRFQPITIKALRDLGARHFCWLGPAEEVLPSGQPQPKVDFGGFVYLFSDELGVPHELDRYFPAVFDQEADQATIQRSIAERFVHSRQFETAGTLRPLENKGDDGVTASRVSTCSGSSSTSNNSGLAPRS
mmetsp:Transcript_29924/g.54499  ORF Transcript_29924/g.54499 Transcript_29924/m.54499 type:complete len:300 (-) Transcript_29924:438-1337(-)